MTDLETSEAWQLSYEKHVDRLFAEMTHSNPNPKIAENIRDRAKEAADAEIALATRPARWS